MIVLRTDRGRATLLAASLAAVVVISVLDAVTPPGVVVGILLLVPVISSAYSSRPMDVWVTWTAAILGFAAAKVLGQDPISPTTVWYSNRVFTSVTLLAGGLGALRLQSLRLSALAARDQALRDRELSVLLHTLLAHELRSPLAMADQALEYVREAAAAGQTGDEELLRPIHGRLKRGLGTVDRVLDLARARLDGRSGDAAFAQREVVRTLEAEARGFEEDVRLRGGRLEVHGTHGGESVVRLDLLILRQSFSLLLGEAVRRAGAHGVRVDLDVGPSEVAIDVRTTLAEGAASHLSPELDVFADLLKSAGGELSAIGGPEEWTLRLRLPSR